MTVEQATNLAERLNGISNEITDIALKHDLGRELDDKLRAIGDGASILADEINGLLVQTYVLK